MRRRFLSESAKMSLSLQKLSQRLLIVLEFSFTLQRFQVSSIDMHILELNA